MGKDWGSRLLAAGVLALATSCSGHDDEFFPYGMTGMNVWLHDSSTQQDTFVGFVEASYQSRQDGLVQCADLAARAAHTMNLRNWGYVCCTATDESSCVTKVR